MMIENFCNNIKTFKCDDKIAKKIFNDLNVLPIDVYNFEPLNENVNIFILSKKLEKYIKENNIEVKYE